MSGIPPQVQAQLGTPATEWAVKTTTALEPEPGTPNAFSVNPTTQQLFEEKNMRPGGVVTETFTSSAVSTPGNEFPGAYPNEKEMRPAPGESIVNTVTETAGKVAQSVSDTAQTYLPMAAERVGQYLPKSVADTMSTYIPGVNPQGTVIASEHDTTHTTSLPSTELMGAPAREHVGGVGALPGAVNESAVPKLPEERSGNQIPTLAGAAVTAKETAQQATYTTQRTAEHAKNRLTDTSTAVTGSTLPTRELDGAKPYEHSSGAGALPGSWNEPAVAALPDEGARGITNATSASVGTHARTFGQATLPSHDDDWRGDGHQADGGVEHGQVSGGVGSLPGHKDEQGVAVLPDERNASGMGKWEPSHSDSSRPLTSGALNPSLVAEDTAMADAARAAGVKSADSRAKPTPPPKEETKQEKKAEGKAGAAAIGAAVGEDFAKKEDQKQDAKKEKKDSKLGESGKANKGTGYDTDYHPSAIHPLDADYSKEREQQEKEKEQGEGKEPEGEKQNEKPLTGAKHADSKQASHASGTGSATDHDDDQHDEKTKKASFMQKMKGEAKILLGKVEGKKGHEKVEEGQRLKAGESPTSAH